MERVSERLEFCPNNLNYLFKVISYMPKLTFRETNTISLPKTSIDNSDAKKDQNLRYRNDLIHFSGFEASHKSPHQE
jgi:hypothetical protein